MNIAVFLGATLGDSDKIITETTKLGHFIGNNNHTLVYGGSDAGLMRVIAKSTQESGGKIIGVELKMFDDLGASYYNVDKFIVTETIQERKKIMIDTSDAFIAIPGGVGTLDEISEIICINKLEENHRPVILLNIDGYYEGLREQIKTMVKYNFLSQENADLISFASNTDEIIKILNNYTINLRR
jgi:uncharacterized protein (TIGR00730 family)